MPKLIKIEKVETYVGTAYRFYVRGMHFGAAATRRRRSRPLTISTRKRKTADCLARRRSKSQIAIDRFQLPRV